MKYPKKQISPPNVRSAVGQTPFEVWESPDTVVRIRRPDGKETWLRVPAEHWERVMDLAAGEFGDKSILEEKL